MAGSRRCGERGLRVRRDDGLGHPPARWCPGPGAAHGSRRGGRAVRPAARAVPARRRAGGRRLRGPGHGAACASAGRPAPRLLHGVAARRARGARDRPGDRGRPRRRDSSAAQGARRHAPPGRPRAPAAPSRSARTSPARRRGDGRRPGPAERPALGRGARHGCRPPRGPPRPGRRPPRPPAPRPALPSQPPPRLRAATTTPRSTRGASHAHGRHVSPAPAGGLRRLRGLAQGLRAHGLQHARRGQRVTRPAPGATVELTLRAGDRGACGRTVERRFAVTWRLARTAAGWVATAASARKLGGPEPC